MPDKKYLDYDGLLYYNTGLKSKFLSSIAYDTTNHQLTMTKNGTASVVITTANLKTELGIDNVGNFKAVSTVANQGLTETEKANARANIGAGDSAFSGEFSDLSNIPTTIAGYGITDAKIENGVITLGSATYNLAGLYKYKGSVATKAALPTHASSPAPVAGDVYNVEADGKNYAYVEYNTTTGEDEWDDLGGTFTITSISNSEIDTILAS